MARFHNTPDGPAACKAHKRPCPYGQAGAEHYSSLQEATMAYERSMAEEFSSFKTLKKEKNSWKDKLSLSRVSPEEAEHFNNLNSLKKSSRIKSLGAKLALVGATAALASACTSSPADYTPSSQPIVAQEEVITQTPTPAQQEEPEKPTLEEKAGELLDSLKDAKDDAQERLESTYGKDWKEKLSEQFKEFDEYIQSYNEPSTPAGGAYDREAFKHWTDTSLYANNCDTRQDILQRDLTNIKFDQDGCTVLSGTLKDPYTGRTIHYVRGNNTVDIDHRVALAAAWDAGASHWTAAQREAFANDPANLIAVDSGANRSKGAQTPATWMPSNKTEACDYGVQYLNISKKYKLRIDESDVAATDLACR